MAFTFAQLIADSFQRVDEDPLGPLSEWVTFFSQTPVTGDHAIIHNNECEITLTATADGGANNQTVLPNDQWVEFELNNLTTGIFPLYLRSGQPGTDPTPCYRFNASADFFGQVGPNSGFDVDQVNASSVVIHTFISNQQQAFNKGDKIRFIVVGDAISGHLYVMINGSVVATANLADSPTFIPSGKAAFQLSSYANVQAPTDIGVINFKAGSVSGAPDSTDAAAFILLEEN